MTDGEKKFEVPSGLEGPWSAIPHGEIIVVTTEAGETICWLGQTEDNGPLARLIASIPDMVAQIEKLRETLRFDPKSSAKAWAQLESETSDERDRLRARNAELVAALNHALRCELDDDEIAEARALLSKEESAGGDTP